MKKGEIWRVLIPTAPGHAQSGERPAIVLQDLPFNNSLPTTLIVPLTSKIATSRFDGTLVIVPDPANGLSVQSIALVFQLRTLDKRNCVKRIGTLNDQSLSQIFQILDKLTGRQP